MRYSPEVPNQSFSTIPFENETPEKQPECLPISVEFLEKLYASRSFVEKLTATMNLVKQFKGREFGFVIWKDRDSDRVWMSKPAGGQFEGEVDMGAHHGELARLVEKRYPHKTAVRMSKLHFHGIRGRDANVIVPSGSQLDLGAASADREWNESRLGLDLPPIEFVGLASREEAQFLVFQEPLEYRPMEHEAIRDELDLTLSELAHSPTATQQDVIAALQHYRYKTMLIETTGRSLREDDLTALAKEFALPNELHT